MRWIEINQDRYHIKSLKIYYLIELDFINLFVNLTMSKWLDVSLTCT